MKKEANKERWKIDKKFIIGGIIFIIVFIILFGFFTKGKFFDDSEEYKALEKIKDDISDYLISYGDSFTRTNEFYSFKICSNGKSQCDKKNMKKVNVRLIGIHTVQDSESVRQEIRIGNLITAGYFDVDFVNPSNNKRCFYIFEDKQVDPVITVYLDEDNKKYYYYVDLSGNKTACHFKEKNSFITNFPDNLVKALKKAKVDLPKQFNE